MTKITPITSSAQFNSILSSHTYTVVDFYADWCGPCKAIAPIYDALATAHAAPGRLAFTKVDVDAQQAIARQYGVSAMPTFLILSPTATIATIRGADAAALRNAVSRAAADAAKAPAKASSAFQSTGHVLGNQTPFASTSTPKSSSKISTGGAAAATGAGRRLGAAGNGGSGGMGVWGGISEWAWSVTRRRGGVVDTVARFLALYVATLFSFDAAASAERSVWSVKRR
ncbi:thioredoxin-like protein [Phyllosticta citriasiana]|uniref:Thioredoxin-like protein n=1 Tax=Phyllosticta citriasiana TaxID=595635 RepID=A0ABR1KYE6_9PEZI